ncbi:TPA: hypothetical protein ACHVUB_004413 [Klebsiella pneumoniae]|uniref:hypothetical protein n=1 Tax=Klebsiella TaxID=570 RepID=UPI00066C45E8|nr:MULTISPECIES: hypothetical protein [Klebsiella]RAZ97184.1 hypothetical protein DK853_21235 [Klebsiella oxytoca]KMV80285.1 hypothetical protein HMPREF9685_04849 [Klebsiella oxytoca 09-7231]MCU6593269.1 hypothetical protein [Klebsiella pneumoniae]MDM4124093.1 hypothetical protein [Klebsiella michiganensis]MDM4163017.1 hypothetical protein [Klebsiella michiganensis]
MYRKTLIITFCIPLFSYADDPGGFVNRQLAKDPALDYAVGDVHGPVKEIIERADGAGEKRMIRYDPDKNIYYIKTPSEAIYISSGYPNPLPVRVDIDKAYKHSSPSSSPMKIDYYLYDRDKYGNIKTIRSYLYDEDNKEAMYKTNLLYRKLVSGDIEASYDKPSPILGEIKRYYRNGFVIKEVFMNSKGMDVSNFRSKNIPMETVEYEYEFGRNKKDPLFVLKRRYIDNGKMTHKSWQRYSESGNLLKTFSSFFNNPEVGDGVEYVNYKFDKFSNWIEREKCVVEGQWGKHSSCTLEQRIINYY